MPHRSRLIALLAALAWTQEPPLILAPPADAAFPAGPVRLIARAAMRLDGKAVEAVSPAEGVFTAEVKLETGVHQVTSGAEKVRFFVGPAAPAEFKAFRPHTPVTNCLTCHAVKNGAWAFQKASLVSLCSQCHDKEKFPTNHTHVMGILADCQMCHNPHGSTTAGHLRMAKEAACKLCHN